MENLKERIQYLKEKEDAIILAHTYQTGDIQDVADITGDSYALSKYCEKLSHRTVVLCGVRFMAESVKILSPDKRVLIPEKDAMCPMAGMVTVEDLLKQKQKHPDAKVVTYINSSAAVKAESDVIVTSSNALKVVRAMKERKLLFVPDCNLGAYIARKCPEKEMILWNGYCPVHRNILKDEVIAVKALYPDALVLSHPECTPDVLALSDYVGSTKEIIEYASNNSCREYIIGTEEGVLYPLKKKNPDKVFHVMSRKLVCKDMKLTTLESVVRCLEKGEYEVNVDENVAIRARKALNRMLELAAVNGDKK